jgi:hypothetical protein
MNLHAFIPHPSAFSLDYLARPRTFPQHTLPLLPLLRSRPGGVHKACVVRSPGSDKRMVFGLRFLVFGSFTQISKTNYSKAEGQRSKTKDLYLHFAMSQHSQETVY